MRMKQDEFLFGEDAKRYLALEEPMERLLRNEDFLLLKQVGEGQAALRQEMLLSHRPRPEGPSDDFLKGAIYAMRLLFDTPQTIINEAKGIRAERAKEL